MGEKKAPFVRGWCSGPLDYELSIKECRMCHRTMCNQCIDPDGPVARGGAPGILRASWPDVRVL